LDFAMTFNKLNLFGLFTRAAMELNRTFYYNTCSSMILMFQMFPGHLHTQTTERIAHVISQVWCTLRSNPRTAVGKTGCLFLTSQ
jgi:hypothetical protein